MSTHACSCNSYSITIFYHVNGFPCRHYFVFHNNPPNF
ncbi:SWIM zinc finger family protein [Selenomonadales bacterium OttesenSCG-928-I06]|nr:SWIM zinc finger family protein [Selenomonadales bacterium OttesenSCG-928-I06]